jgi:hypothetical protein
MITGGMPTTDPATESPLEWALRLANAAVEKGLVGGYAVAGAFAFIYYGEPFATKDLDLMMKLSLTPGGLVDVAPVHRHFVDGGAVAEGQFLRLSRILVDIVPVADSLDEEALREAVEATVGSQTARILTAEHAVAIAVRTGRPRDHMKIARLVASAPASVDRRKLELILERHGLLEPWRRLEVSL